MQYIVFIDKEDCVIGTVDAVVFNPNYLPPDAEKFVVVDKETFSKAQHLMFGHLLEGFNKTKLKDIETKDGA